MSESDQTDVHERIDQLEARIDALEERLETETPTTNGTLDRYDAGVLDKLSPGDTLTLQRFQIMYRKAGIVQESTIKQRIKRLTSLEYFTRHGRIWTFEGKNE